VNDRALDELDAAITENRPPDYSRLMRLQALDLVRIGREFANDALDRTNNLPENGGVGSDPSNPTPPSAS